MRFNPKARLDTSRVGDAGRSGGGGGRGRGGGVAIPGGKTAGGGIVGLIIAVIAVVIATQTGGADGGGGSLSAGKFTDTGRYADCKTGDDANNSTDCARVAVENSLTDFWGDELGSDFRAEKAIVTFDGAIDTGGCGSATSDVGPFYCPVDETIYLDDSFFADVLEGQLDGPAGAFVEPYVLAHEYGHHISNLLGTMGQVTGETGPQSTGVRLELQADCFAGVWAKHATDGDGALIQDLSDADIAAALDAAKTVGDDYIQKQSGGQVNEEVWTHGSSAQRKKWFTTGFTVGTVDSCDTFGADRV